MSDRPRSKRKQRSVQIPVHGKLEHNAGIYVAIGGLVVNWANNESVFLAMLQTLVGSEPLAGNVIWYSQRTTKARLDLLLRLCRARLKDAALLADIRKAAKQFKGYTAVRNRYCHALYQFDDELRVVSTFSMTVSDDDGEPLRPDARPLDRAAMNELAQTITGLASLNRHLWGLVQRLVSALGASHVQVPPMPLAMQEPGGELPRP